MVTDSRTKNSEQTNRHLVVVMIPVHKSDLSAYEEISFRQCFRILGNRDIRLLAPQGLDLSSYQKLVPELEVVRVEARWLSTLRNYNKLKTSRYFYRLFSEYEFLLTYELDCFVFQDELDKWCARNYDYIGAPWFVGYSESTDNSFLGVGNSGFSLRRIPAFEKVLRKHFYKSPAMFETGYRNLISAYLKYPLYWFRNQGEENYTVQEYCTLAEDYFFCVHLTNSKNRLRLASVEDALKFSFEVKPSFLFEYNGFKLPMGCHAWWRYDLEFWKPHIRQFGYAI